MNTRKTVISSVLANDLGIEDFQNGTVLNRGSEDIASYDLSNKLGLLAPLADRADTEVVTFGAEAYNLLGEAKQLEQFAGQQIENINNRFAIAAEIKKGYGVEGFDAFAFGCEGFKETITKAFTAVVAAIKKVIQSITNWIRQVMNWVGSQFAKGQAKLVEKYKNTKFTDATVQIKAIIPPKPIASGEALISGVNTGITAIGQAIATLNKDALAAIELQDKGIQKDTLKAAAKDIDAEIKADHKTVPTYFGKKIDVVKLGVATKAANEIVFGTEKPQKVPVSALSYLNKVGNWKVLLSKDDLKAAQSLVKDGKALIKVLNESLKTADSLAKSMKVGGSEKKMAGADKALNKAVKAQRSAVQYMNWNQRIGSLYAGVLYGTFANYLKVRSYTAAAVKALAKAVTTGKNKPKKGSNAERMAKARQAING
jgi:hypothetical protein